MLPKPEVWKRGPVSAASINGGVLKLPSPKASDHFMVPAKAVVDLETPKQHWRNIHTFHNYKLFSTDANQDPAVKVKADKENPTDPNAPPASSTPNNNSTDAPQN